MTEEIRITSETGGQKGSKLCRMDLIPSEALIELGNVYGKGAEKYDDNNYRKGYNWSLSIAAAKRHLEAWISGEDLDPEIHTSHLMNVAWHMMTLYTFMQEHPEYDDRWVTVKDSVLGKTPETKTEVDKVWDSIEQQTKDPLFQPQIIGQTAFGPIMSTSDDCCGNCRFGCLIDKRDLQDDEWIPKEEM